MVVFGGDELCSLVLDVGRHTVKAGLSGDDLPRAVFPSVQIKGSESHFGWDAIHPRPDTPSLSLEHLIHEARWTSTDSIVSLIEHVKNKHLCLSPQDSAPLCLVESGLNDAKQKAALCEALLESGVVPALYLAKSAVVSAFALGKPTALVLDIGAEASVVTPVSDGFALGPNSGASRTPIGSGQWLDEKFEALLNERGYSPTLPFMIQSKAPVKAGEQPCVVLRAECSAVSYAPSLVAFHRAELIRDFKESTLVIPQSPTGDSQMQGDSAASKAAMRSYEFADGYNLSISTASIGESIWQGEGGLAETIHRAISGCDVDLRGAMAANVVVCGGGSLASGIIERLGLELSRWYSPSKVKFTTLGACYERRFTPWIGGSILSSLGTFQQMWATKRDLQEIGADGVVAKFL